jgi:Nucleotidyltransferase of unknown function (DUF6036)
LTRFDRAQLVAFIRALDRHLRKKVRIVVIGGAAASVGYDSDTRTADIDIFTILRGSTESLAEAAELAREETGLGVGVGAATVADLPYNYEARLRPIRGLNLKNLTIVIPEKYDLALSKAMRGYEHDIVAVRGMHERHRLSERTLVARFETELMKEAVADPRKVALNVVPVVERLYGFTAARKLAERWGVPVRLSVSSSRHLSVRTGCLTRSFPFPFPFPDPWPVPAP